MLESVSFSFDTSSTILIFRIKRVLIFDLHIRHIGLSITYFGDVNIQRNTF